MQLYVGVQSERGSIKKFAFDLLELPVTDSMPKARTLREMASSRSDLCFSLRLHPDVAQAGVAHADVLRAREAAEALGARVIVVPTGPRFTPTTYHRDELGKLAAALGGDERRVAWEPRGVWTPDEAWKIADSHGMLLVRDLTREQAPPSSTIYTRVLPFGFGARMSQSALEHLAAQLEGAETAYVVVQPDGAKRTHAALLSWFESEDG